MSEEPQIYLKEDEVEHVISALSGSTSTRDLAEALGRSESEVLEAVRNIRAGRQTPSEIDLLREQNALLLRQLEQAQSRRTFHINRRQLRTAAFVSAFLLALGFWTMFVTSRRSTQIQNGSTASSAPKLAPNTMEQPARAMNAGTNLAPPARP